MLKVAKAVDVPAAGIDPRVAEACAQVSGERLEQDVRALAFPRSMGRDTAANQRAAAWIEARLRGLGWQVERHGLSENIVARPRGLVGACTLVGAHYDSVPGTPGADDDASGVAAHLRACASGARPADPDGPGAHVARPAAQRPRAVLGGAGVPAVMWTDTSEFRNPHYHRAGDTPATLDYEYLRAVTQVLVATVLE